MEQEGISRSYYAIIPANVRYDNELTPNAKLLYGEITALCNDKGYCWAKNEYFSKLYDVSEVSISKWVNSLIKKGYIQSEMIYKDNKTYRLLTIVYDGLKEKLNTPIEEKLKHNNTSSNNTLKEINKESFSEEDLVLWFNKTYEIYPKKVDKIQAKQTFEHKLRGLDKETAYKKSLAIYRMLERQNEVWKEEEREPKYIKSFSHWLNANVEDSAKFKRGRKK